MAALQSVGWALALPPFQGPDEDAHFAYVQHFAETGELPSPTSGPDAYSSEQETALVTLNLRALRGDLGGRPAWSAADLAAWRAAERALPAGSRANGSGPNPQAKNPPLYYVAMSIPYRMFIWLPLLQRIFVLRLANALFFLATVVLTWLIAGELFGPSRFKQTLAAGAVALEPQLAFMSAVINADILLVALMTAVLLASLRMVNRGPTMRRVLSTSALSAAAVLTHGRGLVALPVLAVALVAAWSRHRPALADTLRRGGAAVATVLGAFLAYLSFGRASGSGSLYGGQVSGLTSGSSFNVRQFLSSIYQFYLPRLGSMRPRLGPSYGYKQVFIDTFYGTFGWLEVQFRERVYDVLQVLSGAGLVGLYTAVVVRRRRLWRALPVTVVLVTLLLTQLVFLHYVSYRSLLGAGSSDPLIVGRYLLPIVALFGIAIAFTVGTLPRVLRMPVGVAILALGVLLALGGIGITAARFYA